MSRWFKSVFWYCSWRGCSLAKDDNCGFFSDPSGLDVCLLPNWSVVSRDFVASPHTNRLKFLSTMLICCVDVLICWVDVVYLDFRVEWNDGVWAVEVSGPECSPDRGVQVWVGVTWWVWSRFRGSKTWILLFWTVSGFRCSRWFPLYWLFCTDFSFFRAWDC